MYSSDGSKVGPTGKNKTDIFKKTAAHERLKDNKVPAQKTPSFREKSLL